MKKVLLVLVLGLFLFNCKKELKKPNKKIAVKAEENGAEKELKFRLENPTQFELKNLTIGLPDTALTYKKLSKKSQTEWTNVKSAYHYGFVRFFDSKNRKYFVQPTDYVGETPFKKGELKFIIKSIDSTIQEFELGFEYKNN